jgi:hypothetical protein
MAVVGVLGLVAAAGWATARVLEDSDAIPVQTNPRDAAQAQQKLLRLAGGAREDIVLTEDELTAFVARNLDRRDLPLDEPVIRLRGPDVVEMSGRVPLGRLLEDWPVQRLADLLASDWRTRPIALRLTAQATLERGPRRQLRLDVRAFRMGRQPLPPSLLCLLSDPACLRFVRIPVPDSVAAVRIETGRAVIQPISSRGRT